MKELEEFPWTMEHPLLPQVTLFMLVWSILVSRKAWQGIRRNLEPLTEQLRGRK